MGGFHLAQLGRRGVFWSADVLLTRVAGPGVGDGIDSSYLHIDA